MSEAMFERLEGGDPNVPTEERAQARLRRAIELGELEELLPIPGFVSVPRYLVTYMNSQTANNAMRSATVVVRDQPESPDQPGVCHVLQRLVGRLLAGGHGSVRDPAAVHG